MAPLLDRCTAAFLPVHQDKNKGDAASGFLNGVDRLQGRAAGRDDIVHDHDRISLGKITFDPFLPPVILGRFPHGEYLERILRIIDPRRDADAQRDWIGPHRKASNRVNPNVPRFRGPFHELPPDPSYQQRSARVQSCHPGVHVEVTLRARSQCEIAMADGLFREECE